MSEPMGLREFGRLVGLSGEGVRKAIKTGRIPPAALGTVTLSTGKTRPAIIDVDLARQSLGANTDERKQRDQRVLSENRARVARGQDPKPPRAPADDAGDSQLRAGQGLPTIVESNQKIAAAKAQMALLELNEKKGRLVDAEKFLSRYTPMIAASRTKIMGVPTKAKQRIPHLTAADVEALEEMIAEALTEIADGR